MWTPQTRRVLAAFSIGLLFGAGLLVSGMTDPRKVLGFLDVFGAWNPALAFVMAAAVSIYFVAARVLLRRPAPLLDSSWHVPANRRITPALVFGAALFGIGWGLSGYCPGPALVSLAGGTTSVVVFVGMMLAGMALAKAAERRWSWRA
jgi:uncharacterized membrane protein YedE/YeeE